MKTEYANLMWETIKETTWTERMCIVTSNKNYYKLKQTWKYRENKVYKQNGKSWKTATETYPRNSKRNKIAEKTTLGPV